jgi:glycosyltransferase 2 family protein
MNKKQQVAVIIGILISVIFLWIAFYDLRPADVVDNIQQANIMWLLVGATIYFLAVTIIALRWQFLLRAIEYVPLSKLTPLVAIGYMGNNVYPFRSGEALRIFLLKRNHNIPIVKATTTVIVERVFDGLVMLTFIVVPLSLVDIASEEINTVAQFAAPIFLSALLIFFILTAKPNVLHNLIKFFSRPLPERIATIIEKIAEEIIHGLEALRSPSQLAGAIISSYTTWAIEAGVYWIVSFAFDLDITYWVALMVVGTVNLAGLIPASPGQVGVFEFFASTVLVAAGIEETLAASYALTVHIVIWLPVTLVGFYFLVKQGLGWQAITQARSLGGETQDPTS